MIAVNGNLKSLRSVLLHHVGDLRAWERISRKHAGEWGGGSWVVKTVRRQKEMMEERNTEQYQQLLWLQQQEEALIPQSPSGWLWVGWLLACSMSRQHASAVEWQLCQHNCTCCHTWEGSCRPHLLSPQVTVHRHRANQCLDCPYNDRCLAR